MKQREIYHPIPPNLPLVLPFFAIFCPYTTIFAHIPPYMPILTKVKGNPLFFIPPFHLEVKTLEFWCKNIYRTYKVIPPIPPVFAPGLHNFAIFCTYSTIFAHIPPYMHIFVKVECKLPSGSSVMIPTEWHHSLQTCQVSWRKRVTPPFGLVIFYTTIPPCSQNPRIWSKNIYETKRAVPPGTTSFAPGFALFRYFLPMYHHICPCTTLCAHFDQSQGQASVFHSAIPPRSQNPRILGQKSIWNKESGSPRIPKFCPWFALFLLFFAHIPPYLPIFRHMCPFSQKSRAMANLNL